MNSVAVQQKRFLQLVPSNNSSTGFSPSGSQPIIRFNVADMSALALLKDARLNFKMTATKAGGAAIALTDDINVDSVLSNCGVMDQVIVTSSRFGNTLEQVLNLGRLESSYYRSKYSPKMMASNSYHQSRSVGLGRYNRFDGQFQSASSVNDRSAQATRKQLIDQGKSYSLPFHVGLFLSDETMDLSAIGGLSLSVYLQKSEALFHGADAAGVSYTLSDVSLTLPVIYKTAQQIATQPAESVISFLNWTSLYSVLDSTSSSIAYRLMLKGLISGIHNMLPTAQINNSGFNQFALKQPGIESLTQLRDGVRAPYEKQVIVADNTALSVQNKSTTYPEVITDYLSAWSVTKDQLYSQTIPENLKGVSNRSGVFSFGANYDPESSGINVNGVLSFDIKSKLQKDDDSTLTEPYAMFSYFLSRQSFVASPQGLVSM